MKIKIVPALLALASMSMLPRAGANTVSLADWCVSLNGDISTACNGGGSGGVSPGGGSIFLGSFDRTLSGSGTNNLGSITLTLAPGNNQFALFYADYDVDYSLFGSFDDYGTVNGSRPAGFSYSLSDPNVTSNTSAPTGFVLFDLFSNNTLDNVNSVGTPQPPPNNCCDAGLALGLSGLNVPLGETGTVKFNVTGTAPAGGFYLQQTNQDTNKSIYVQASFSTSGGGVTTPEPSFKFLLLAGLLGGAVMMKRYRAQNRLEGRQK